MAHAPISVDAADAVAEQIFGYSLRPSQRSAVAALVGGRDTLEVLPTGSGRSARARTSADGPRAARPGLGLAVGVLDPRQRRATLRPSLELQVRTERGTRPPRRSRRRVPSTC